MARKGSEETGKDRSSNGIAWCCTEAPGVDAQWLGKDLSGNGAAAMRTESMRRAAVKMSNERISCATESRCVEIRGCALNRTAMEWKGEDGEVRRDTRCKGMER